MGPEIPGWEAADSYEESSPATEAELKPPLAEIRADHR